MKKSIVLFVAVFFAFSLTVDAQNKGKNDGKNNGSSEEITWYSWEEGYKKAKKENKIMIVDAYTDWCYWCKVMDNKTYSQEKIITAVEKDFVAIKINPELEGTYEFNKTKYSGGDLIDKLANGNFRGYPTTFFVFPGSSKSYAEVGYLEADVFEQKMEKYLAMNPKPFKKNDKGKK